VLPDALLQELRAIVGPEDVLSKKVDLQTYEYDGYLERSLPDAVVFVQSTDEVAAVVRMAHGAGVACVPRGSATNLTGGTIPALAGIVIEMARMRRVVEVDTANERMIVEPGIYTEEISDVLDPLGYYYAPDPSSGKASSLGGNIAENAGGPHCFKYGVTLNHVLGAEVVLPDGEVVWLGGKALDLPGYDLLGAFIGSEGTFGVCTKAVLRILRKAESVKTLLAIYDGVDDAARTVSAMVAAGMVPATLELMDKLAIRAVEESHALGFPRDAGAVLLIELDGLLDGLEDMANDVRAMCGRNNAREIRVASSEDERTALWKGRKGVLAAVAGLAPSYLLVDGTVPRSRLPEALRTVHSIGERHGLAIANFAHAGDGNLHPVVLFDSSVPAELAQATKATKEILAACVELGGTISGEHGIGIEKADAMNMLFTENDLRAQNWLKEVFDPAGLCNPGKVLPRRAGALVGRNSKGGQPATVGGQSQDLAKRAHPSGRDGLEG
jgi:glycolate oxidase